MNRDLQIASSTVFMHKAPAICYLLSATSYLLPPICYLLSATSYPLSAIRYLLPVNYKYRSSKTFIWWF